MFNLRRAAVLEGLHTLAITVHSRRLIAQGPTFAVPWADLPTPQMLVAATSHGLLAAKEPLGHCWALELSPVTCRRIACDHPAPSVSLRRGDGPPFCRHRDPHSKLQKVISWSTVRNRVTMANPG
jgi:hypothetical protein